MVSIVDLISGITIMCKSRKIAERIAKERLAHHNSSFAYSHRGFHLPENAYIDDRGDTIYIRRRD